MGVPAFFRWLSGKYPSILVYANESYRFGRHDFDFNRDVDLVQPNTNGIEFDNLYLDMNGIIHPCTHPTNKPAPETEEEMILAIFEYIDRLMALVRPRRLLYMAVDGVAPRAKLNQQRSRRFRSGQERLVKEQEIAEARKQLGVDAAPEQFDSNCITPGTEFMFRLTDYLRLYIADRIETNPGWAKLKIVLSDASVPGEGEHKVMQFIRTQRSKPGYDPNTRHCLCGADADLIMLGLISHEPHFSVLREEYVPNQAPICDLCKQRGHTFKECKGTEESESPDEFNDDIRFFFIRLDVLREYIKRDLVDSCLFARDLEKSIDDWVFICFFVGNDFLPNLPCLEIREQAIDRLVEIYAKIVDESDGKDYLCSEVGGQPNMDVVRKLLIGIADKEDQIMRQKRYQDQKFRERRNRQLMEQGNAPEPDPNDKVRLGDEGYKTRYYTTKFKVEPNQVGRLSSKVAKHYARGLCWVLQYYYNGCPAWNWYYPYHYAPFASDFLSNDLLDQINTSFEHDSGKPFTPMQQLMAVYPASSSVLLPEPFRDLMSNPKSPIIDFYPKKFALDLNGKRFDWQSIVLLPFIDQKRLLAQVEPIEKNKLNDEEKARNVVGKDKLFVKMIPDNFLDEQTYQSFGAWYLAEKKKSTNKAKEASGFVRHLFGKIEFDLEKPNAGDSLESVISNHPGIPTLKSACLSFTDPVSSLDEKKTIGRLLNGVVLPELTLKSSLIPDSYATQNNASTFYHQQSSSPNRGNQFRQGRYQQRFPIHSRAPRFTQQPSAEPYRPVIGFNTRARATGHSYTSPLKRVIERSYQHDYPNTTFRRRTNSNPRNDYPPRPYVPRFEGDHQRGGFDQRRTTRPPFRNNGPPNYRGRPPGPRRYPPQRDNRY